MNDKRRILRMAGLNDEILKKYSPDSLNEMAIKATKWNDIENKIEDVDISAREMAKRIILDWLNRTGYWKEEDIWGPDQMTSREKKMVDDHLQKFLLRIYKMLKPKKI